LSAANGTNRLREHSGRGIDADPGWRAPAIQGARARYGDVGAAAASADGGAVSTVIENLLSRKQQLVEQLEKTRSIEERDRIEHQLEQINTALDFLDRPESNGER
jgi:hypothetical protein